MIQVLVGVRGRVPWPTWHSLVILFSLSVSVKDRSLLWMVVRSQTYDPEHILAYGSGKAHCSLVVGSSSFSDRLIGDGDGGDLSTTLSPRLRCGGLESKFGRDLDPLTGEWWVGLACAWDTSGACVLGYPVRIHQFTNRHVIRYDLAIVQHHSKNQKMKDGK